MAERLAFRKVAPEMAPFRFSRQAHLSLAYRGEAAGRFASTAEVQATLKKQKNDALIWCHLNALPQELVDLFATVQTKHQAEFSDNAISYLDDLRKYCRAVGLASLIGAMVGPEQVFSLPACNIMIGDPALISPAPVFMECNFRFEESVGAQKAFFGEDYDRLTGRSVLLASRQKSRPLSSLVMALYLVNEIGCIKLVEQAARLGMKADEFSKEAELFFTNAYAYNFAYYLFERLRASPTLTARFVRDIPVVVNYLGETFGIAAQSFQAMDVAERFNFLNVTRKPGEASFGEPFAVKLVGPGVMLDLSGKAPTHLS